MVVLGLAAARIWPLARSEILAGDAELPHHGVQRGPMQSEAGGGRRNYAAAFLKHTDDMLPLHLLERGAAGGFGWILPYFA